MVGIQPQTVGLQEEVIKALLVNAPAIMDIAEQLELTPREVRGILHESLLRIDGADAYLSENIPIVAQSALDFSVLNASGECTLTDWDERGGQS